MYEWAARLNEAFKQTGWNMRELARQSGVNYAVVSKCLYGEVENPRGPVVAKLARAVGVNEVWLRTGFGPMSGYPQDKQPSTSQTVGESTPMLNEALQRHIVKEPFMTGARDLPLLGRARGGVDGFFIEADGPVVKTYRPHLLEGVAEAYAVECWDDSMSPALRHGWQLWVHPGKPVKAGDAVVIQLNDGQALVKEYVRRNDREWTFAQYNPKKELKIPRAKVKSVHLVVGNSRGML